jgi:hypothetical protein
MVAADTILTNIFYTCVTHTNDFILRLVLRMKHILYPNYLLFSAIQH